MIRKLILAVAAAALPFVALELGLRGQRAWKSFRQELAFRDLGSGEAPGPDTKSKLWQLLRSSEHPELHYELRPNLDTRFLKRRVTTDTLGFRITGTAAPRGASEGCTILGLGDSVMFGWGVADQETYLSRLLVEVGRRHSEIGWRVVNTAVPGYNLAIEIATLEVKGLREQPDLVILGWTGNDLDLPNFMRPVRSALSLDESFFRKWLELRLRGSRRALYDAPTIRTLRALERPEVRAYLEALPPEKRHLVGREAFERSMTALADASTALGFEVLVLSARGRLPKALRRRARALGFDLLEIRETRLDERGGPSELVISRRDPHPSAFAHELISEALAAHVESTLDRLGCSGVAGPS
jgi:lysophospholipase L1-like esterase